MFEMNHRRRRGGSSSFQARELRLLSTILVLQDPMSSNIKMPTRRTHMVYLALTVPIDEASMRLCEETYPEMPGEACGVSHRPCISLPRKSEDRPGSR